MNIERTTMRRWARWFATGLAFPLAGVAARLAAGNIDSAGASVVGGVVGGAVLGALQAGVGGIDRPDRARWVAASALGFGVGLGVGAGAVGYDTDPASLAVMGAISGAAVGLTQALSISMRLLDRAIWALTMPVLWAGAWLISSQVIVDAERQHAMFGGPAALTVGAITGVMHVRRQQVPRSPASHVTTPMPSAVL